MRIREWKARGAVVKLAVGPSGDGMAGSASGSAGGKVRSNVIRHVTA